MAELGRFIDWLTGAGGQGASRASSARTLRRQSAWCWRVEPVIAGDGVVHDWLQLDGIYLAGMCCLIAESPDGPVGWQWCDREKQASWAALLVQLPAPQVVVCDGQPGLLAAVRTLWPNTKVQRCLVHVRRDVRTDLTLHPKTPAGRGLVKLAGQLPRVADAAQAADWLVRLDLWWQAFGELTSQRTYRTDVGEADVPVWAKPAQTWWYTHQRLRRAWRLLERLAKQNDLFRFLQPDLAELSIPPTSNRIEGGVNAQLRRLLGHHRGMPPTHQARAVEWWLWLHWANHPAPGTLIRPECFQPVKPRTTDTLDGPAGYDTGLSTEEGLWARKGWAGRWQQ